MADQNEQRKIEILVNGAKANASVKEMEARVALLTNQWKKTTRGTQEFVQKSQELKKAREQLSNVRKEVSNTQKGMGGLRLSLTSLVPAFSAAFAAQQIFNALGNMIRSIKDFQKEVSTLRSLTGASAEDIRFYTARAREIGPAAGIAAVEVVKAFTKIGSAQPILLKNAEALAAVTERSIVLSQAAGIDLTEAADAVTSSLNQYGASAAETDRFINALAAGSKAGAAIIPDVASAIEKFGVNAASANVSFEESVALVETLAVKNIKGSEAGTKLRNVLIDLQTGADDTNPAIVGLSKALENLEKKQLGTTELTKLFGEENLIAGQILIENRKSFEELTEAVTGTNTAYEQQEINMDNISGAYDRFTNSFDKLLFKIESGDGIVGGVIQGIIEAGTSMVNFFASDYIPTLEKVIRTFGAMATFGQSEAVIKGLEWMGLIDSAETRIARQEKLADDERQIELTRIQASAQAILADQSGVLLDNLKEQIATGKERNEDVSFYNQVLDQVNGTLEQQKQQEEEAANSAAAAEKKKREEAEKTAKLKEDLAMKEQKARRAFEDLQDQAIADREERERAQLERKFERELEDLQFQGERKLEAEKIIREQREQALKEQEEEFRQIRAEEEAERLEVLLEKEMEDEELEKIALEEKFLLALQTEEEHQLALYDVERKFLERKLDLLKAAGKGETKEAQKINNQILANEKAKNDAIIAGEKKKAEFEKQLLEEKEGRLNDNLQVVIDIFGKQSAAGKLAAIAQRRDDIKQVIQSGYKEVQHIWENAAKIPPPAGPIWGAVQTGIAVVRSANAVRDIAGIQFAQGGMTDVGSFAPGGHVKSPAYGIIGEAGSEWVAPNWMLRSPRYANHIAFLESARQARAYQDGGPTLPAAAPAPVPPQILQDQEMLLNELREINQTLKEWPERLQVVNDILDLEESLDELKLIRTKATIG